MAQTKRDKELLTELNEEEANLGLSKTLSYVSGESLILYGWQKYHHKPYRHFYGIGKVFRVVKGDKQDLLYMRFSVLPTYKPRLVVVYENMSRRQILTLKRGQWCQVFGICKCFTAEFTDLKTKEKKKRVRMGLYASGINAWYVPTMIDIKKLPPNEDLVAPSEKEQEIQETFEDVLNEFLNGTGEE